MAGFVIGLDKINARDQTRDGGSAWPPSLGNGLVRRRWALALGLLALALVPRPTGAVEAETVPEDILRQIEDVVGMPGEVSGRGLEFSLNAPDGVYREGGTIEFRVTAPDYEGYLYLDYYQIDGNVVHILPVPGTDGMATPRGSKVIIGAPGAAVTYEIFPPFGRELLVLMASPKPLFDRPRQEFEEALQYLEELRKGTARVRDGGAPLAVIYRAIQTHAKDAVIAAAPKSPDRAAVEPAPPDAANAVEPGEAAEPAPLAEAPVVAAPPRPQDTPSEPPKVAASGREPLSAAQSPAVDLPVAMADPAPVTSSPAQDPAPAAEPAPVPAQTAALPTPALPPSDEVTQLRQRIGDLLKRMQQAPGDNENLAELVTAYRDYAQKLVERGDYDKASRSLAMAMALDPTNEDLTAFSRDMETKIAVRLAYDDGLTQLSDGKADAAYESFQAVLRLDPDNTQAQQRVSELTPEVVDLYHKKALIAFRRQDLDQALEIWDKVLAIDPDHQKAKLNRLLALDLKERLLRLQSTQ